MNKKDRVSKTDQMIEKLVNSGLNEYDAAEAAKFCMGIAYKKTISSKALSYNEFKAEFGESKKFEVYETLLKENEPMSRQDLAYHMNYKMSTICGRISELRKEGYVVVCGTKIDPETKKVVQPPTTV